MLPEADEIIALLQQINDVYLQTFDYSLKIKELILNNDIEELDKVVNSQNALNMLSKDLEEKRQEIVRKTAESHNIDYSQADIDFIASLCDDEQRDKLLELKNSLAESIARQISINEANAELLCSNLNYINFVLDITENGGTRFKTYSCSGRSSDERANGIIDTEI